MAVIYNQGLTFCHIVGSVCTAMSFSSSEHTPSVERMAADDTETEMEYINMAVENSMLDDYSLYVYLADSDAE